MKTDFELGTWLGRRQGFSICVARASASDAACLCQIRNNKLYKSHTSTWADFCAKYLGGCKTQVDLLIRNWEEFGYLFFLVNQLTRVTPETYRAISSHISTEGIQLDGQLIALEERNITEVSAAVEVLRARLPESTPPRPLPALSHTLRSIAAGIRRLRAHRGALHPADRDAIVNLITRLVEIALGLGIEIDILQPRRQ